MKIIVCTSSLTYVPKNYDPVLQSVLTEYRAEVVGVVLVRIPYAVSMRGLSALFVSGCVRMAHTLLCNMMRQKRKVAMIRALGIPLHTTSDVNAPQTLDWLRAQGADLVLTMRTRCLFDETLRNLPRLGCVNVHHGLLPTQRGLMADLRALARGEQTGVSIHRMRARIDAGEVYARVEVPMQEHDYCAYLERAMRYEIDMLRTVLGRIVQTGALPEPQLYELDGVRYTHDPTCREMRALIRGGMKL